MSRDFLDRLNRDLIDRGLIVKAGFEGYRLMVMHEDAPPLQVRECEMAFFMGAKHLFDCMVNALDAGDEVTEADITRLEKISAELEAFGKTFAAQHAPTRGSA